MQHAGQLTHLGMGYGDGIPKKQATSWRIDGKCGYRLQATGYRLESAGR